MTRRLKPIDAVRTNCALLPDGDMIKISRKDFREIPSLENRVIVCNPPYGIRLKKEADLTIFFKDFGDFLKQKCKGATAYIYFGNRENDQTDRAESRLEKAHEKCRAGWAAGPV